MKSMYIGSADTSALLAKKTSKSYGNLLRRFVSDQKPYYNAKASPIDALRTGSILEDRYSLILSDDYYSQYRCVSKEMDVLRASIDFAALCNGKIVDFDELKTSGMDDFLLLQNADIDYIKKKYRNNYLQVQEQLYCSELEEANIVFLVVYAYDDEVNYIRDIKDNEFIKFRIQRDEDIINKIKNRAEIFQQIKNNYYENR